MRQFICVVLFLSCVVGAALAGELAGVRFEQSSHGYQVQVYEETPYLWLGMQAVGLTADIEPSTEHKLMLLWGSKNDQRQAVVSINGVEQRIAFGGYDGFGWLAVPVTKEVKGKRYEIVLRPVPGDASQGFISQVRLVTSDVTAVALSKRLPDGAKKIEFFTPPARKLTDEERALWDPSPKEPDRMRGLVDDIFKHARCETKYGNIPSTNVEVNGELLQILPRLYCMTGDDKYLAWAHRLADHYLLGGGFIPSRLSDHGCEIIGGLGLLYAIDRKAQPAKCEQYKPHMKYMFDEILRRGTNSDGIIIQKLQDTPGPHDSASTGDGWGYDFVGFKDFDLAEGTALYNRPIHRALSNLLKPRYENYNWGSSSRDNIADSVEGGLYLLYYQPVAEGFVWADRVIERTLVDHADADRLWGTHKLEANTVRTVLIHTMLHTQNTIARPWRQGLQLGTAPCGDGICIYMACDKPYQGRLEFDIPRHRLYMGFGRDWPRMNTVPEWFTVEPDETRYDVTTETTKSYTGRRLHEGIPIKLQPGQPLRMVVKARPRNR